MNSIQTNFPPGSSWLYYKLYISSSHADQFLVKKLLPFVKRLLSKKEINKFFFIRYNDPSFHLRIRFHISDREVIEKISDFFYKNTEKLIANDIVWKYEISTYTREMERYNPILIDDVEDLFQTDSLNCLSILKEVSELPDKEEATWKLALKNIDYYLNTFLNNQLEMKEFVITQMSESFKAEFGFTEFNSKQLNSIYRDNRKIIDQIISENETEDHVGLFYNSIKKQHPNFLKTANALLEKCNQHQISIHLYLSSYIHMMMNRIFPSKNRLFELMLYFLLSKHYKGMISQQKYNSTSKEKQS
ncbi:thiopeptide-type bacteriocin biosynthesis protein [Chryseobacterium sp. MYb264]|uniref:thiopeptide-type bacteriocin biosynthesis protein n=1 Tax=Chryseobacterium sp. MYb264 TaxID=2745153 RepID=UPI002E134549|nr:thiopeptide-type bacteriocin biosynthesis protein [Chryseobacterium sp. MYb264]